MVQWRVRDVMTRNVITAAETASVGEVVALLRDRRISAAPIVDSFDVVIGVVSWTDLRAKIKIDRPARSGWRRYVPPLMQWPDGTAVEVMSGPPLTIGSEASLPAAGRIMHRQGVSRLLVVDRNRRLRGIVTRSDLMKVHARLDSVLRDEVVDALERTLAITHPAVRATVDDGVVTLTGRTERRTTAVAATHLAATVPGVVDVLDRLTFDIDDTAAAPPVRPHRGRGWWTGLRRASPADRAARGRLAAHAGTAAPR